MCCLFAVMALIGPRFAILVWWIFDQPRWEAAFSNFWVAFIGWLAVPWTTLGYALVFPGGVTGFDWVILALAVLADLSSWTGGGVQRTRYVSR